MAHNFTETVRARHAAGPPPADAPAATSGAPGETPAPPAPEAQGGAEGILSRIRHDLGMA